MEKAREGKETEEWRGEGNEIRGKFASLTLGG